MKKTSRDFLIKNAKETKFILIHGPEQSAQFENPLSVSPT